MSITYPSLDQLILGHPPGTLLVPVCAKELLVLRILGSRWQRLTKAVVDARDEQIANPTGFGPVEFKFYVARKMTKDNVVGSQMDEIDLPQDFFEWPLPK